MSFLLDTNVLSQMRRPHLASERFRNWVDQSDPSRMFISVITLMEIELGVVQAKRKDHVHASVLRDWIDVHVTPVFSERALIVDAAVARRCAPLQIHPDHRYGDALIAATALVHDLTVVTRNIRHFEPFGVRLLNPFT
ncbi:MAG TPA: type II toxin-antitoxin system VapC family toxin [Devosia sp.]